MLSATGFIDRAVDDPLGGFAYLALSDVKVVHDVIASWTLTAEGPARLYSKRQARPREGDGARIGGPALERAAKTRPWADPGFEGSYNGVNAALGGFFGARPGIVDGGRRRPDPAAIPAPGANPQPSTPG
jgi:hypothetical protein